MAFCLAGVAGVVVADILGLVVVVASLMVLALVPVAILRVPGVVLRHLGAGATGVGGVLGLVARALDVGRGAAGAGSLPFGAVAAYAPPATSMVAATASSVLVSVVIRFPSLAWTLTLWPQLGRRASDDAQGRGIGWQGVG
jgi:hypothetical protein